MVKLFRSWEMGDGVEQDARWTVAELAEAMAPYADSPAAKLPGFDPPDAGVGRRRGMSRCDRSHSRTTKGGSRGPARRCSAWCWPCSWPTAVA